MIRPFNGDCINHMAGIPDNHYDLLIADPPYGIGMSRWAGKKSADRNRIEPDKKWDSVAPSQEFFDEMIRVSKNQIIFGANHFINRIPYDSPCWIIWDKRCGIVPPRTFADAELAWTSFDSPTRVARFLWDGFLVHGDAKALTRIHPTQKPVELYEWIFDNYAEPGHKVLDPFGGSFSSAIAAHYKQINMDIVEIDPEYYERGMKRFKEETTQLKMF